MSFRTLNKNEGSKNPAVKFLEWKSNQKCFGYYDKEKGKDVLIPLPIKFQFMEEFHTIKGYHEESESSIYSNEIKTMQEELTVRSFKLKEPIAKGLYNDIKHQVKAAGGKYGKSIYALLNDEIVNFQLYGASISPFILYTSGDKKTNLKGHSHLLESNFIEVKDFVNKKKGSNKYTEPVFSLGDAYNTEEYNTVSNKYLEVSNYFYKYSKKVNLEEPETVETVEPDDLDF